MIVPDLSTRRMRLFCRSATYRLPFESAATALGEFRVAKMAPAVPRPGDVVAELLRNGAQTLLVQALEAEIAAHPASYEPL